MLTLTFILDHLLMSFVPFKLVVLTYSHLQKNINERFL